MFFSTLIGAVMLGIVAVWTGIAGLSRVKRRQANNPGVAISGIVLGVLALLVGLALTVPVVMHVNCLDHAVGRAEYARC